MAKRSTKSPMGSADETPEDDRPVVINTTMMERPPTPKPRKKPTTGTPLEVQTVVMDRPPGEDPLKKEIAPKSLQVNTKLMIPQRKKSKNFISIGSHQPQGKG